MPLNPLVCIMGPTAAGKTALAMELAARFPLDVISVDSAMVYRRMDIGTGKPNAAELAAVPHALVNIREPHDTYSAADFARDARRAAEASWANGRVPALVGGTGLYFRALLDGLSPLPPAIPAVRARIEAVAARDGVHALHDWLQRVDPRTAARLHPNDAQRLERALEVCLSGGEPMSARLRTPGQGIDARVLRVIAAPVDRARLHAAISTRFEGMLAAGLVDEVAALMSDPLLERVSPSMRCVGYRQTWDYLAGDTSRDELVERGKAATRQLARRQLTWLRRESNAQWLDPGSGAARGELGDMVRRFLGLA